MYQEVTSQSTVVKHLYKFTYLNKRFLVGRIAKPWSQFFFKTAEKITLTRMHSSRIHTIRFSGHISCHAPALHHTCPPAMHIPHHACPPAMHAPHAMYAPHHTCPPPCMPPPHMSPCHTHPPPCTPPTMHAPLPHMPPPHMPPHHTHPCHTAPLPCTPLPRTHPLPHMPLPSPVDRIVDTRFWKHYLYTTSFADGN